MLLSNMSLYSHPTLGTVFTHSHLKPSSSCSSSSIPNLRSRIFLGHATTIYKALICFTFTLSSFLVTVKGTCRGGGSFLDHNFHYYIIPQHATLTAKFAESKLENLIPNGSGLLSYQLESCRWWSRVHFFPTSNRVVMPLSPPANLQKPVYKISI